ncbi:MAG: protein translocase subunit SecDF [Prevotella sp.]|jgi:SecD/SecF fusion protein|nr:protein translocase subunit SecDF [Prevotella sp.]MCH3995001.1 protein translocase subunit SecDF [Prevotella sp.]
MHNKGLVICIAVLLTLASIFYLSFSVATSYYDYQAAKIKDPIAAQDYKDSVKYLGIYSYKNCLETQIGLGLDLKGGMNVVLEVSVPDVVEMLADHKTDPAFTKSLAEARAEEEKSQSDFISLFIKAYHKNAPGHKLAEIFSTQELQGKVSPQSSDSQVEKVLRSSVQSAIDNSFNVVRTRIDKFGVVQPNIQRLQGQEGRIMVEMPGIREPERIRKLLQGSANLEFWDTYNAEEIAPYLQQLDQRMVAEKDSTSQKEKKVAKKKVTKVAKPMFKLKSAGNQNQASQTAATAAAIKQHPLLARLQLTGAQSLALVGYANVRDTAAVDRIIYSSLAKQVLPSDLKLLWGAKPAEGVNAKNVFELYALKVTTANGQAPLQGDVITDAKDEFDQFSKPVVSMTMNSEGARDWAQMTKANIGKAIAIVLDGSVYSAPRVNQEIDGGSSQISGNFTIEETKDLANTLKSGRMPAPAHIVQEEIVGPSLGAQSIHQGFVSFIIAFVLLMIFMCLMYDVIPGMIANGALIVNLFFTLGILASFQSALTMPGIAGIVLTLGTAVDANVLIYERVREEMRRGKGIKQAIELGYKAAFSAIFDSNVTSLITGVILLAVGTGPIRGFATTWIIGLICSFFTAVFLTRLVYEHQMKHDRWQHQKFYTAVSKNLMQNTHYHFMAAFKKSRIIWGIALVVCIVSFAVRGMSRSIDFTGGRNYVVTFEKAVEPEQVRDVLENAFVNKDGSKATTTAIALGTDHKTIRVSTNWEIESSDPDIDNQAEAVLYKGLKKANLITQASLAKFKNPDIRQGGSIISSQKVGPSSAKDITYGAVISVLLALFAIFLYILIRFRNVAFSLGSIVALACDALLVIGVFSLFWGILPFSLEVDQTFIGAILTVIGYSMNDKVVVFDRIRENLRLHPQQAESDLQGLFNDSINETLARTVNTSAATLIVLLCIFFLGGESIRSFSFAMILGVIFGTLSSIFIASPVAYLVLGKHIRDKEAHEQAEAATAAALAEDKA